MLYQVSVSGFDDEIVWGVSRDNLIWKYDGKTWQKISGSLNKISVGEGGVWGLTKHNHIYYRTGTYGGIDT